MSSSSGTLSSHRHQGVRRIIFGHPAHNSIPSGLLTGIAAALDEAATDEDTRAVVLASEGERTFCAGANFDELLSIEDFAASQSFFMGFANVILAMRRCPKPVVVAVQGKAVGGGVGIAAAADYCLATEAASVRLSELSIAIGPFVILPALERKMGAAPVGEMAWDTEWHDAVWAHQNGLYQRTFPDPAQLRAATDALASQLATHDPKATASLKQTLWMGTDHWPDLLAERAGVSGRLLLGSAAKQALAKFKAR